MTTREATVRDVMVRDVMARDVMARSPVVWGPAAWGGWELGAAAGAQAALFGLLWAAAGLGAAAWAAGAGYGAALLALLGNAVRRSGRGALGPADRVTLGRAVLVGGVTALVVQGWVGDGAGGAGPAALVGIAAVALLLDGVDGAVARRTGTSSAMGARFDMEVDAFLILVLSVQVSLSLGAWVLLIGGMRYAFVVAGWALPWLRGGLPPSTARKAVAAMQGVVLAAASARALPEPVAHGLVLGALGMLVWSFGRDTVWLWNHGRAGETEVGHGTGRAGLLAERAWDGGDPVCPAAGGPGR
ncbi:CDP-alcohol phosphatidyltransferase family protein [Actinomadura namibiensis]|uniref:Phosphatidylglycerophosphate synthase n=1 Tax=Actinomadura namibiensis TaxID=182080 RepID=A0A7W3LIQ8_ACTNM|nr:CDP-alcohol phosphatidyltransferase family protein [Actinomadura namibiensis]MBA8948789.1 phosphatidylglycerophosphate synthase [Actinomadura namibiensis]